MKLIVGLGNPTKEYINTRHNIGFMLIDKYLEYKKINLNFKDKFNGSYLKDGDIIYLKPMKYMNLSGEVVKKYVDYFNIDINDILIICDDINLYLGNFKIKPNGSSGGHNGLKNIELNIGTSNYKRLRIGVGKNNIDMKDYVLGKFSEEEIKILNSEFKILYNLLDDYFNLSFDILMNKYNTKNR